MKQNTRDRTLAKIDRARAKIQGVGLRRYAVTLRRRIYPGEYVGDGVPIVNDIPINPAPRVRAQSGATASPQALAYILANTNLIKDRYYKIDKITPAFVNQRTGATGGYTPQQLRMKVSPDFKNVEPVIILLGDDGYAREATQIDFEQDRAFGYSMLVQEIDRVKVQLRSIAILPLQPQVIRANKLQLTAMGTFADGNSYDISPIVKWTSDTPTVATIDLVLGLVTGAGPGTTKIRAQLGTVVSPPTTLTVV